MKFKISMNSSIKVFLGIEDFKNDTQIIDLLKRNNEDEDFSESKSIIFFKSREFRLRITTSKLYLFIVKDDGFKFNVLLKRKRNEFAYEIIKENKSTRFYIKNTITTLPLDTVLVGGLPTFEDELKKI